MTSLLLIITVSYIFGIWHQYGTLAPILLASSLISIIVICVICRPFSHRINSDWRLIFPLSILVVISASLVGAYRYQQQCNAHRQFQKSVEQTTCTIYGTIIDIRATEHLFLPHLLAIQIDTMQPEHTNTKNATLWIYTKCIDGLEVGDSCMFDQVKFRTTSKQSFDQYLMKEGIKTALFVPHLSYTVLYRPQWSFNKTVFYLRKRNVDGLKKRMSPHLFALYSKIFLGSKEINPAQLETTKEQFKIWGLSHQLARSGLHMALFAGLWYFILRFMPCAFNVKQIILLLMSILYFLLSWSSIPFDRAFFTFVLQKTGILLRMPIDFLHLLTIICFFALLYNPVQLCFLDFQLSFGLTFAIAFLNHLFYAKN